MASNSSGNCGNSIIIISNSQTEMINEVSRLQKQKNDEDADGEVSGNNNSGGRRVDGCRRKDELTGVMKEFRAGGGMTEGPESSSLKNSYQLAAA